MHSRGAALFLLKYSRSLPVFSGATQDFHHGLLGVRVPAPQFVESYRFVLKKFVERSLFRKVFQVFEPVGDGAT